jgi:peptidoglycan/LPS O-acetylase OafA/YrhL
MRGEFAKSGTLNLKHFWLRRIYRIWPPFYLVLLATALTLRASGPPFYSQLLHVTNYWSIYHGVEGMPAGTGIYWSLAVEERFYLLFPWIFLAMQRMSANNQATLLYAMCAAVLAWRCWLVFGWHVSADRTYMATDTRIDSIIFGCALAVSNSPVRDKVQLVESRWLWIYVPTAAFLMGICLVVRNEAFRETLRYSLQFCFRFCFSFTWANHPSNESSRSRRTPPRNRLIRFPEASADSGLDHDRSSRVVIVPPSKKRSPSPDALLRNWTSRRPRPGAARS